MDRLDAYLTREDPRIADDEIRCPHCGTLLDEDVYHASSQDTLQVYRCSGCGRYTTERGIALAQEVERLQGKVDYWRSEFETTRKQRDALAAENRRMLEGHKGDPCIFCGKMHDEDEVGPCPGPA